MSCFFGVYFNFYVEIIMGLVLVWILFFDFFGVGDFIRDVKIFIGIVLGVNGMYKLFSCVKVIV